MFTRCPLLKLNILNDKIYYKDVKSSLGDEYGTNKIYKIFYYLKKNVLLLIINNKQN